MLGPPGGFGPRCPLQRRDPGTDAPHTGRSAHMHLRGKDFRYTAHYPNGKSEILLNVPDYDFNWQHFYVLAEPLELDDFESLSCVAKFDNSIENPTNPDAAQHVTWGDQTWEEMAIAFFEVAQPLQLLDTHVRKKQAPTEKQQLERTARVEAFVNDFFQRFDSDGDGQILGSETSTAFKRYGFRRFDHNRNGRLDREEIRVEALKRM